MRVRAHFLSPHRSQIVTYNASTAVASLYIDGNAVANMSASGFVASGVSPRFGASARNDSFLTGAIYLIAVYDKVLSASAAADRFNATSVSVRPPIAACFRLTHTRVRTQCSPRTP